MNVIFQQEYFEEELPIWEKKGAIIASGLYDAEHGLDFAPIIARGTIAFYKVFQRSLLQRGWPDLTWPFNNNWNKYSYDRLLLCSGILNDSTTTEIFYNTEHSNLPIHDVESCFSEDAPRIWIRSVSGSKNFSGGVFSKEEYAAELQYLEQKCPDISLVISTPKILGCEWRVVIINDEIISASQYMDAGNPVYNSDVPTAVLKFAERWRKQNMFSISGSYVLDVCEYNEDLKVVEANNLLTSGWYSCDVEKIVDKLYEVVGAI
jgi:hypothetical protein